MKSEICPKTKSLGLKSQTSNMNRAYGTTKPSKLHLSDSSYNSTAHSSEQKTKRPQQNP